MELLEKALLFFIGILTAVLFFIMPVVVTSTPDPGVRTCGTCGAELPDDDQLE